MLNTTKARLPIIVVSFFILVLVSSQAFSQQNPLNLQLASRYQQSINIQEYWVSEKLDGIRAYWDGQNLYTRGGHLINVPSFFTKGWPNNVMEGELWIKRNAFELISGLVQKQQATDKEWLPAKFMIFDLPKHSGTFTERIEQMRFMVVNVNSPHLQMIEQYRLTDNAQLTAWLEQAIAVGGEGLMLHKGSARYQAGRSNNIMKLKPVFDDEAEVIAHLAGKGKYKNQLGAIKVKTAQGVIFKIGSGFSDLERMNPPPIGSIVTYQYSGKTAKGVPRFAHFLRVRRLPDKIQQASKQAQIQR